MYPKEITPLAQAVILATMKLRKTSLSLTAVLAHWVSDQVFQGKVSCLTGTFWASLHEAATWQEFLNQPAFSPMEGFV